MAKNNPHSVDRSYKFIYKTLGIKFHRYLFDEGEYIEFIKTEIPGTGLRKDIVVKVDRNLIRIIEFMSKALYDTKLIVIFDYFVDTYRNPLYEDYTVKTTIVSTANPNHGKNRVTINDILDFYPEIIFIKKKDGQKVLSTLTHKVLNNEELSDDDAIDLLLLPDMDIDLPIKTLMKRICYLIGHANIPDVDFKRDIIVCETYVLARFFRDDELLELIELLKTGTINPKYEHLIQEFGAGFEVIYTDARLDTLYEVAENLLKNGFDEEVVSLNTGLSLVEIKNIKRRL